MGPCALFWGGASSAQIATLGIPEDLTSKSDHNTGGGGRGGRACLEGGRSQQGSPGGRASGSGLWDPVWASAHELDRTWFLFASSSEASFGPQPLLLLAVTATSPEELWRSPSQYHSGQISRKFHRCSSSVTSRPPGERRPYPL